MAVFYDILQIFFASLDVVIFVFVSRHKDALYLLGNIQAILIYFARLCYICINVFKKTMELRKGSKIAAGRFKIERVLGQGGFGITYLAVHTVLEETVAIKEFFMKGVCERDGDTSQVTVSNAGNEELVSRYREKFLKEARNIYRLKHKNIITVTDVFEENGTAYYVMEYVGGISLADKVRDGAIPELVAVRYIRQVAAALDYVHSKRMMHLDVKPANILLDKDDNAVLIDFGLAKQYDSEGQQTSTTPLGISHGYAPMEQYKRGGVSNFSPATDVYSLGATLFKLVTGITPPEASDVGNEGLPVLPSGISPAVRGAIEAAMQSRIKDRPQSIAEFLSLLTENGKKNTESGELSKETIALKVLKDSDEETKVFEDSGEETIAPIDSIPSSVNKSLSSLGAFPEEKEENAVKEDDTDDVGLKNFLWAIGILIAFICIMSIFYDGGEQSDETIVTIEEQERLERKAEEQRQQEEQERIAREQAAEEQARLERERIAREKARIERDSIAQQSVISTSKKVDLGLSVCWAGYNVGASSPEGFGNYYAWGETTTKKVYDFGSYQYDDIGRKIGGTKYDVARLQWGGSWRMPTKIEFEELVNRCILTWTTYNGVNGYKVTGPNGNSIFFPAAGYHDINLEDKGTNGYYWASTLYDDYTLYAYGLSFFYSRFSVDITIRERGRSVRPVCDK